MVSALIDSELFSVSYSREETPWDLIKKSLQRKGYDLSRHLRGWTGWERIPKNHNERGNGRRSEKSGWTDPEKLLCIILSLGLEYQSKRFENYLRGRYWKLLVDEVIWLKQCLMKINLVGLSMILGTANKIWLKLSLWSRDESVRLCRVEKCTDLRLSPLLSEFMYKMRMWPSFQGHTDE